VQLVQQDLRALLVLLARLALKGLLVLLESLGLLDLKAPWASPELPVFKVPRVQQVPLV
jgi:hypothetical protein